MIVGVFFRRASFEIARLVVPAIFVDVVNVEVRPEVVNLTVGIGGEPVEVQVAVVSSVGVPNANPRIVVEVELDARPEDHADHPHSSDGTTETDSRRRGPFR